MNILLFLLTILSTNENLLYNYTKIGNGGCREGTIHHTSMSYHIVNSQKLCEKLCSNNPECTGIEWFLYKPNDINCQLQEETITNSYNNTSSVICLKKIVNMSSSTSPLTSTLTSPLTSSSTSPLSSTSTSPLTSSSTSTSTSSSPLTSSSTSTSPLTSTLTSSSPLTSPLTSSSSSPLSSTSTSPLSSTSTSPLSSTSTSTSPLSSTSTSPLSSTSTSPLTSPLTSTSASKSNDNELYSGSSDSGSGSEIVYNDIDKNYVLNDDTLVNELNLRANLFNNYVNTERPVKIFSNNIKLKYGIEIKSLEKFDQKGENIEFNLWITQLWNDEYLKWNVSEYKYKHLSVQSNQIWIPDLELYNSASKPIIYDSNGGLKLNYNGDILWIRPTRYSFACKLNLKNFPFDSQECTMIFGSWKYNSNFLDLRPFNNHKIFKNISIDPNFSHNEWNIVDSYAIHEDIEYLCCPGELWPNTFYTIVLERNYTKYMVVIAMTLLITIASLVILTFSMNNYTRTFVLVFLPLSIIWLQVYISSKIPVIQYYTLMEKLLITCFIITILNAVESGFVYIILNEKYNWMHKIYNYKTNIRYKLINNTKIVNNTKDNNGDVYQNLNKHIMIIDNSYKLIINILFIIIISILLK